MALAIQTPLQMPDRTGCLLPRPAAAHKPHGPGHSCCSRVINAFTLHGTNARENTNQESMQPQALDLLQTTQPCNHLTICMLMKAPATGKWPHRHKQCCYEDSCELEHDGVQNRCRCRIAHKHAGSGTCMHVKSHACYACVSDLSIHVRAEIQPKLDVVLIRSEALGANSSPLKYV